MTDSVAIIINPISGTGGRPDAARRRAELAASICERRGVRAELFVTERGGHARELAAAAVARGVRMIFAWGGDGTVNEVASALVFTDASLGIVPTGSGNGLARELGAPLDARRAIDAAIDGAERTMDAGELDGHLFFNIAGIGLDARIAHRFTETGLVRRGLRRYAEITLRELCAFQPDDYAIVADGATTHVRAMLIAIANSRQYGHGAVIAPGAGYRLPASKVTQALRAARPVRDIDQWTCTPARSPKPMQRAGSSSRVLDRLAGK